MTQPSFLVERHVGRLLETRLFALETDLDAERYARAFWNLARSTPGAGLPVLLADHRPVRAYSAPVLARLDTIFASLNVKLERVALVADRARPAVVVQLQRVVDRASFSGRKLFTDGATAVEHVGAVLDPAERARAATFLSEWPSETGTG